MPCVTRRSAAAVTLGPAAPINQTNGNVAMNLDDIAIRRWNVGASVILTALAPTAGRLIADDLVLRALLILPPFLQESCGAAERDTDRHRWHAFPARLTDNLAESTSQ
jgi:hypothetical protein